MKKLKKIFWVIMSILCILALIGMASPEYKSKNDLLEDQKLINKKKSEMQIKIKSSQIKINEIKKRIDKVK